MSLKSALKHNPFTFLLHRRLTDLGKGRGWRGFHSDVIYQQLVVELLNAFTFSSFVETGTFRGYSTEHIAMRFPKLPIITAEVMQETYDVVKPALSRYPNIEQMLGSSDECIAKMIAQKKLGNQPLFYLDAHWEEYWPLNAELDHIASERMRTAIVIDDFQVPGHPQFEFDSYPKTRDSDSGPANLQYIRAHLPAINSYRALFPKYGVTDAYGPSGKGFNPLRGHIVLFQNMDAEYETFLKRPLIQKYYFGVGSVGAEVASPSAVA
jgi:hypothetical protein